MRPQRVLRSIPHHELMKSIARRVSDGALLGLIKVWLEMSVEEADGHGGKRRSSVAKDSGRGTPRGTDLAAFEQPLHAAIRAGWKQCGHEKRLKARVVVYADDFVILCRGTAMRERNRCRDHDSAQADGEREENADSPCARGVLRLSGLYDRAMLLGADGTSLHWHAAFPQVNEGHLRRDRRDDAESNLSETCSRSRWGNQPQAARLGKLLLPGAVSRAYRAVDNHARHRLRQWLNGKHRSRGVHPIRYPATYLHEELGLLQLERRTAISRGRKHELPCPKAGCGKTARPV